MLDKWWQWLPFSQNLTVSSAVRVDPLTFLLHPYLISYGISVQSMSVVEVMITIVVPCPGDSVLQFFPLSFGSYLTPQCFLSCRRMVYISCLGLSSRCHLFSAPWVAVGLRIQHCLLERGAFLIMSWSKFFLVNINIYIEKAIWCYVVLAKVSIKFFLKAMTLFQPWTFFFFILLDSWSRQRLPSMEMTSIQSEGDWSPYASITRVLCCEYYKP